MMQTASIGKRYAKYVAERREAYLNFKGENIDPITQKKRTVMKSMQSPSKEFSTNSEDLKKVIFKLAVTSNDHKV